MSNSEKHYTFNTAALKAVTIDGLLANFRKTDTKTLSIDGVDIKDLIKTEGGFDFKRDWKELILDKESKNIVSNDGSYIVLDEHGNLIVESEDIYENLVDGTRRYACFDTPLIIGDNFEKSFPNLKIGNYMFINRRGYEKFVIDCPVLEDAEYMFSGLNATYFKGTFPSLTTAINLFDRTFTDWNRDQNGIHISEMELNIPNVKDASGLFYDNGTVIKFTGDLSSLEDATGMFSWTSIYSFDADLPNLKWGHDMFRASMLDKNSIIKIISSLKNENTWDGTILLNKNGQESGKLTLCIDTSFKKDEDLMNILNLSSSDVTETTITCKGGGVWNITIDWR